MGFYDNTPAAPAPAASTAPVDSTAQSLYGQPEPVVDKTASPEVQAVRAADVGRALYATDKLFADTGLDAIDGLDHVAATELMRDLGADPTDARQLAQLVTTLPNATASDVEAWVAETSRIGPADMQMARDFLKTDPRTLAFIQRHPDLAFHPDTVKRVIGLAKAARLRASK